MNTQRLVSFMNFKHSQIHSEVNSLFDGVSRLSVPYSLSNINVLITEHCNFACGGCSAFSTLAKPTYADVDTVTRDLERVSNILGARLNFLQLAGGEPLLHPNVIPFFEVSRKFFPNSEIRLVTNGLLLPKQDEHFWESIKKNNIVVMPTKYPSIDYRKLEECAATFGVKLHFVDGGIERQSLFRPLDLSGAQNELRSFIRCSMARCLILKEGRLYPCLYPSVISHFNEYFDKNINVSEGDSLDIYKINEASDIFRFIANPIPFCRYCDSANTLNHGKHVLTKRDISEYVMPEQIKD
ncbi:radical SAM protein [Deferribacterales bacterium RsTz2092]|nr:UDP pyrophosphate phosphatase [Deferribacterales bacterium]